MINKIKYETFKKRLKINKINKEIIKLKIVPSEPKNEVF